MKAILITVVGLITSLPSFCQTDTTINETDTNLIEVVCIPKSVMINVIKDLKEGDIAKEEVAVLNEQIELQNKYTQKCDLALISLKIQVVNCQSSLDDAANIGLSYKLRLDKVERKLTHKKKWVKILLSVALTSIFINIITN